MQNVIYEEGESLAVDLRAGADIGRVSRIEKGLNHQKDGNVQNCEREAEGLLLGVKALPRPRARRLCARKSRVRKEKKPDKRMSGWERGESFS